MAARATHPFLFRAAVSALASLVLLGGAATGLLALSNELHSFGDAVETSDDVLWGPAFGQMDMAYKLERAAVVKPEVLVLGSSRANQFRAEMFPGARFYNASGAAHSFDQALEFLRALYARHKPEAVILTVDPWWFQPGRERDEAANGARNPMVFDYRGLVANLLDRATDPKFLASLGAAGLRASKDPVGGRRPLGYRAAREGSGYRPDGSVQYGAILLDTDPYQRLNGYGWRDGFAYFRRAVEGADGRFRYTGEIDARASEGLRAVIAFNRGFGIDTVIVLPPLAAELYRTVQAVPSQRDYFARLERETVRIGAEGGAEAYVLHDLARLGVDDRQTIDGVHGDELAFLALTRHLARAGSVLARHIDAAALERLYQHMQDPANRPHFNLIAR